ncbi:hypothetical protein ACW9H7_17000 [Pseudomonas yamanorum]|uniref:hypothetical protein n=1 Tax=Pseudomonas yamanorum TaxID=515393 RepID=UPI00210C8F9B|nr:hypothetical protein [Pseudomonas yamanorum]
MNKICGIVVSVGLALSGCATKTPERTGVTPAPAVVQQVSPEPAAPTPAKPPVSYGAASANGSAAASTPVSLETAQPESETNSNRYNAEQCRKEMEVLKVYNKASYNKYNAEYQVIANKTSKYMGVKDSISSDINDMVMPAYQFQIREFCFRVKTRLTELVIRQARQ